MLRMGGWLGGGKAGKVVGHSKSLNSLDEVTQIQDAMSAVTYIMADDMEAAEAHLSKGSSPFHLLGVGVVTFMRATLGFEQEIMREASNTLSEAENSAYEHQRRALRHGTAYQSPIYPPGTEYAVCQAEAQMMSAIVGVLHESLTEAIKSFYKLRKAFLTLEGVMEAEKKFLGERSESSLNSTDASSSSGPDSQEEAKDATLAAPAKATTGENASAEASKANLNDEKKEATGEKKEDTKKEEQDDDDFDFVDAEEEKQESETPQEYMGHLNVSAGKGETVELDNAKKEIDIKSSSATDLPSKENPDATLSEAIEEFEKLTTSETVQIKTDASLFSDHPVDIFIISGSNFCYGMLLLLISLVPPAFSTLLKIVGFKGDKERGMQMLWQSTKFHNIHGAMGGVVLFGYYNGLTGFCDIIPQSGEGSYPQARCKALLAEMRQRYPKSHFWLLEEARMLAYDKELEKAIEFMKSSDESLLTQLEALRWFERSLSTMYIHDYEGTVTCFEKCITLNNWSHGLYYYICGASYVELYRLHKTSNPDLAKQHATKATEYFQKVAPNTGKKKFMARQLPFDIFVNRKIQKWELRAKEWSCDFIDAIGVSPIEEMIYFWNGYKRMRPEHLQTSLANLSWSENADTNPYWGKDATDEAGILAVLRAAVYRNMGDMEKAKEVLNTEVIGLERGLFKGHLKDSWTAPCARYEMAASVWAEADVDGRPEQRPELLRECLGWLDEVARWEGFDLDARIGMKVTAGKGTLKRYGIE